MARTLGQSLELSVRLPRLARDEERRVVPLRFDVAFEELFDREYPRLFRYLDRLSGEPDLAADLAQEAFIRLHRRGSMPDRPALWLVTVALNLFRNERSTSSRRKRLLNLWSAQAAGSSQTFISDEIDAPSSRVRQAMNQLSTRERALLVLRAEGYSYREIASALDFNEASVGTLLARARQAFRRAYDNPDAPR